MNVHYSTLCAKLKQQLELINNPSLPQHPRQLWNHVQRTQSTDLNWCGGEYSLAPAKDGKEHKYSVVTQHIRQSTDLNR